MTKCPNCGSENPDYAFYCGICSAELKDSSGKPYVSPKPAPQPAPKPAAARIFEVEKRVAENTANPEIGGMCVILAGILAVFQSALILIGELQFMDTVDVSGWFWFWGVLFLIVGMGAILLGARAMRRIDYSGALIGAVLGMIGVGFGIGSFLALGGLVLIALSREEFSK